MVYFTLKDSSDDACTGLISECNKYLKNHDGIEFFAVGRVASEYDRPVNVRDFDVALNVVFSTKEAHDKYQVAPEHLEFIDKNKENWEQVRVLDAHVS